MRSGTSVSSFAFLFYLSVVTSQSCSLFWESFTSRTHFSIGFVGCVISFRSPFVIYLVNIFLPIMIYLFTLLMPTFVFMLNVLFFFIASEF